MTRVPPGKLRVAVCASLIAMGMIIASGCAGGDSADPSSPGNASAADAADAGGNPIAPLSIERVPIGDGQEMEFVVVLPPGYSTSGTYPVVVALPPGDQRAGIAESTVLELFFRQARDRGWVVISPIAPEGRLFFDGSERQIPLLLDRIGSRFTPEGGRYHLVGLSNGGVGAFKLAIARPRLFHSLTVFPGFPRGVTDISRLERLKDLPVRMIVGQLDSGWVEPMRRTDTQLRLFGADVTLQVEPGEGHFIGTVDGERIFDTLEPLREQEEPEDDPVVGS